MSPGFRCIPCLNPSKHQHRPHQRPEPAAPESCGGQAGEGRRGVVSKIQTITENNQEQLATLLLHIRQVLGDSAPLHFQASAAVTLNYFQ